MTFSFLTINDYTIIVNKAAVVQMGGRKDNERPYEAFISINQIEYNSEYRVDITEPDPIKTDSWKATNLSVSPSIFGTWWDTGFPYIGTETFTINQGTKTGLRFTLTCVGYDITIEPGWWHHEYRTQVTLNNGGQNWRKGDVVNVSMKGQPYTITVTGESKSTGYQSLASCLSPDS